MTREQYAKLTDEEVRIMVAEFAGWERIKRPPRPELSVMWKLHGEGQRVTVYELPDYVHDLNAMHKVEKLLDITLGQEITYMEKLIEVMSSPEGCYPGNILWHASAAQRVEAFVLTMEAGE